MVTCVLDGSHFDCSRMEYRLVLILTSLIAKGAELIFKCYQLVVLVLFLLRGLSYNRSALIFSSGILLFFLLRFVYCYYFYMLGINHLGSFSLFRGPPTLLEEKVKDECELTQNCKRKVTGMTSPSCTQFSPEFRSSRVPVTFKVLDTFIVDFYAW